MKYLCSLCDKTFKNLVSENDAFQLKNGDIKIVTIDSGLETEYTTFLCYKCYRKFKPEETTYSKNIKMFKQQIRTAKDDCINSYTLTDKKSLYDLANNTITSVIINSQKPIFSPKIDIEDVILKNIINKESRKLYYSLLNKKYELERQQEKRELLIELEKINFDSISSNRFKNTNDFKNIIKNKNEVIVHLIQLLYNLHYSKNDLYEYLGQILKVTDYDKAILENVIMNHGFDEYLIKIILSQSGQFNAEAY